MRATLFALIPLALAAPAILRRQATKPIYWLLAGDSTTATNGGWGYAFLSTTVASGSTGHNYGHSGATTRSFRAGGDWANVTRDIGTYKDDYRVYVTIQVWHSNKRERERERKEITKTPPVRPQRPKAHLRRLPSRLPHQPRNLRLRSHTSRRNTHPPLPSHPPHIQHNNESRHREPVERNRHHTRRRPVQRLALHRSEQSVDGVCKRNWAEGRGYV